LSVSGSFASPAAALVAARHNSVIGAFYQQLPAAGKAKKFALAA